MHTTHVKFPNTVFFLNVADHPFCVVRGRHRCPAPLLSVIKQCMHRDPRIQGHPNSGVSWEEGNCEYHDDIMVPNAWDMVSGHSCANLSVFRWFRWWAWWLVAVVAAAAVMADTLARLQLSTPLHLPHSYGRRAAERSSNNFHAYLQRSLSLVRGSTSGKETTVQTRVPGSG